MKDKGIVMDRKSWEDIATKAKVKTEKTTKTFSPDDWQQEIFPQKEETLYETLDFSWTITVVLVIGTCFWLLLLYWAFLSVPSSTVKSVGDNQSHISLLEYRIDFLTAKEESLLDALNSIAINKAVYRECISLNKLSDTKIDCTNTTIWLSKSEANTLVEY